MDVVSLRWSCRFGNFAVSGWFRNVFPADICPRVSQQRGVGCAVGSAVSPVPVPVPLWGSGDVWPHPPSVGTGTGA